MATKVASTATFHREAAFLVDTDRETTRSELESSCRALVFSFVKMRDSEETQPLTLAPDLQRGGNNLSSISANTLGDSGGSSVDVTDSSVDLATMAQQVQIDQDHDSVQGLVPTTLPSEMRSNIPNVVEEDLKKLYDVEDAAQRVQNNELSTVELVALHLRSYRNILNYEIFDVDVFHSRFVNYFGSILADLMEVCYADRGSKPVYEVLAQDFQTFKEQDTQSHKPSNSSDQKS